MSFELILPFFPPEVQRLLLDPEVSDVCINGDQAIFVERRGVMLLVPGVAMPRAHLNAAIEQIARALGRDITEQDPIQDLRLPNGSRVAAVYHPSSPHGASLTVRKFNRWFTLEELVECGSVPPHVSELLIAAIQDRRNVLISGGTGAGKSTVLNAMAKKIPPGDRLVVIEKPVELEISHQNVVRWEAVDELPGRPPITVAHLVVAALRHRPDRIIVGEVRDHAAFDMLQAMNTGHSGSLTTTHADSATLALHRVSDLALSAYPNLNHSFVRSQTAEALHFVLQVNRGRDGARRVTELVQCHGYDNQRHEFLTTTLYSPTTTEMRQAS